MILDYLDVDMKNARKTEVFKCDKNLCDAIMAYRQEDCTFDDNSLVLFIHRKTREIEVVRDYGMYGENLTCAKVLFKTDYVPISIAYYIYETEEEVSSDAIRQMANDYLDKFEQELKVIESTPGKPLFPVGHKEFTNDYLVWSLRDRKHMYVYDYTRDRTVFRLSDEYMPFTLETNEGTDYTFAPPSQSLLLGLNFGFLDDWNKEDNDTEYLVKEAVEVIPDEYRKIYDRAVSIINIGRRYDYAVENEIRHLESLVERFEEVISVYDGDDENQPDLGEMISEIEEAIEEVYENAL